MMCVRLASLKREGKYTQGVEHIKDQESVIQRLQEEVKQLQREIQQKNQLLEKERTGSQAELERERDRQLAEVTQQWSIECEGKMKVIGVLEKEVEQLKAQIQHLEGRVIKYKKYWKDTRDLQHHQNEVVHKDRKHQAELQDSQQLELDRDKS